ncbi:carboxypeptidase M32 [Clostridium grantii]|uniref:Metal-dependent carboxypeptidase n=1 Tax=Clostridium grantii DSM 8605 TaxID=1121316 RepID=A0A1M5V441_9CLOT|nr:carboxypeptidase M32 [Clostridium grantii]SHH70029.1 carboxypeptidase Taq [Clostridium grantii DSM 8605]
MLSEFKEYVTKIEYLNSAMAVLSWDAMVNTPSKGKAYRGEILGFLSGEYYKLITDDKVKVFIDYFNNESNLDDITNAMVKKIEKSYNEIKKIPEDFYIQYTVDASISSAAWEEAKNANDFSIFKPHLEKMVDYKKKFVDYLSFEENKYDTLLDMYEPGITVKKLDEVFSEVRDAIVMLLKKIETSDVSIQTDFFTKYFSKNDQEEFSKFILSKLEYDFISRGRIDESEHPFTTDFGKDDVRITTHYYENDFRSAMFGCIHEGGHAIYEQDISKDLMGTGLAEGTSMGIHESQSRFYENILGRSKEFWSYFYPEAQKKFPQFESITLDQFYKAINKVEPSLIRIEADELTYSLHVIIRYELEKMLINDELKVEDLPTAWNKKYKDYLGVEPSSDADGVLQDMHWSDGSFGYFPSYALGNLYGAQMVKIMEKDIPNLYTQISQGNFSDIHNWLKENVHKHGAVYKPAELIKKITGEELKSEYFINYLNKKYSEIYNLV